MRLRGMMGAAVLLLVVGGVAACGDDDDSDTSTDETAPDTGDTGDGGETPAGDDGLRQEYVDAIVFIGSENDNEAFPEDARLCVAESFVDAFGAEQIQAAGITPEDITSGEMDGTDDLGLEFSEEQASAFYDQMTGCVDLRELVVEGILGAENELTPELIACLDENLTDDLLEQFFVTGFTQGDEGFETNPGIEQEFETAVTPCIELIEG